MPEATQSPELPLDTLLGITQAVDDREIDMDIDSDHSDDVIQFLE